MTNIRTHCPRCGDLELAPPSLHLHTYSRVGRDRNYYEFRCPKCSQLVVKPAYPMIVQTLRAGRVPETHTPLPDEVLDPKREEALPLSYDDLLDFVLKLKHTDEPAGD